MNRRILLKLTSLFALSLVVPPLWHVSHSSAPLMSQLERRVSRKLHHLFRHISSAQAIGAEYLRNQPRSLDAPMLLANLSASCEQGLQSLVQMDDVTLRNWLTQQQRQDFAEGKTVRVKGWVLSQTEVELYALLALT